MIYIEHTQSHYYADDSQTYLTFDEKNINTASNQLTEYLNSFD